MLLRINPAIKGVITAVLMIIVALILDTQRDSLDPSLQYFIFAIYAAGILWALVAVRRSEAFTGKFMELFSQGFRCFIVVTLIMVAFTAIFIKVHPEFAEAEAKYQRAQMEKENVSRTPAEMDELETRVKKQYAIRYISASIFGYLVIGAALTAAASVILTRRK